MWHALLACYYLIVGLLFGANATPPIAPDKHECYGNLVFEHYAQSKTWVQTSIPCERDDEDEEDYTLSD